MPKKYDRSLKRLCRRPTPLFLELLLGRPASLARVLPSELVRVESLYPDLVLELDDGGILQVEFQGRGEKEFGFRMASYFVAIRKEFGRAPRQVVLWIANGPLAVLPYYEEGEMRLHFNVFDPRNWDGRTLFGSTNVDEQIFSVLCNLANEQEGVRRILERIVELPPDRRREALQLLLTLGELRGLVGVILEEQKRMPITYDVRETTLYRMGAADGEQKGIEKGIEKGIQKGREEGIARGFHIGSASMLLLILRERFGTVPKTIEKRIQSADSQTLARWAAASLHAKSLNEVFAPPA